MADSFTSNLDLTLPEVGASRDTWGAKVNSNFSTLDQFVGMAMPVGAILDFCGTSAPSGWLVADGRTVSRTTYSALFAVLGTHFGAGDGSTTFALPNLCGRSGVGPGTVIDQNGNTLSLTFAQPLGNLSNQIIQAHLPNYAMATDVQGLHYHSGGTNANGGHQHTTDVQGSHSHGGNTGFPNTGHTHNGATDTQGNHLHNVNAWGLAGGPSTVAPGAIATGNTIQTDVQGAHYHNFTTYGENQQHYHNIVVDGAHAHTTTYVGDHVHGIYGDGNHQHTIYLGGSSAWFPVLGPVLVVTKIIYCGIQATTLTTFAASPASSLDTETELAEIKAELTQLRAMLFGGRRHVMSSPMRGPH